jgi:hypothetical protein
LTRIVARVGRDAARIVACIVRRIGKRRAVGYAGCIDKPRSAIARACRGHACVGLGGIVDRAATRTWTIAFRCYRRGVQGTSCKDEGTQPRSEKLALPTRAVVSLDSAH